MYLLIVDFDRVLYRTDEMKKYLDDELRARGIDTETFWEIYSSFRSPFGSCNPDKIRIKLNREHEGWGESAIDVFNNLRYDEFVNPNATEALKILRTLGIVVILSQGDRNTEVKEGVIKGFQARKIARSGLRADRRIVRTDKLGYLPKLLGRYKPEAAFIIDDDYTFLSKVELPNLLRIGIGEPHEPYPFESFPDVLKAAEYIRDYVETRK